MISSAKKEIEVFLRRGAAVFADFVSFHVFWNATVRIPLAPCVGEPLCVRDFAKRLYGDNLLEVNFEFSDQWNAVFEKDKQQKELLEKVLNCPHGKKVINED